MHTILLVDDSQSALQAIKSQIDSEYFCVVTAQSVAEAWVLLEKTAFDCILTDFEMPDVNGPEFCRRVKSNVHFASIPVIMLTSLDHPENLLVSIDAGADDFISKDSDMRIILAKIRAMVRMKSVQDELAKLRRVEGLKQIVATFNHEFNTPLTIALGNLNWLKKNCSDSNQKTRIERLQVSLERMCEIVKKIRELRDYVEASYSGRQEMVAISTDVTKQAG